MLLGLAVAGCQATIPPPPPAPPPVFTQIGLASWYGPHFTSHRTADGERFDGDGLTAAHRSLPLGTKVRVTNLDNGRSIIVRINDRGPFSPQRIIDLSPRAASELGIQKAGLARVRIEVVAPGAASL
jgi:rare lipoprotein A